MTGREMTDFRTLVDVVERAESFMGTSRWMWVGGLECMECIITSDVAELFEIKSMESCKSRLSGSPQFVEHLTPRARFTLFFGLDARDKALDLPHRINALLILPESP